jgi:uncharacterized protein with FMN-binding domain
MAKMDKKWVILCSTAVAAVYSAGLFSTEVQANKMDAQYNTQVSMQVKGNQPSAIHTQLNTQAKVNHTSAIHTQLSTQAKVNHKSAIHTHTSTQAKVNHTNVVLPKNNQPKQIYKDGTYTGTGMNRRGSMEVAVTLKNDKITDVEISNWGMHYSENDVIGLPHEVLKNQSPRVRNVSGATYSTQAFEDAVQEAILQAHNS